MRKTVEDVVSELGGELPGPKLPPYIEPYCPRYFMECDCVFYAYEEAGIVRWVPIASAHEFEATAARMGYRSSGIDRRPIDEYEQQGWDEHQARMKKPDSHYSHQYKGIKLDPYRIAWIYNMQGGPREQIMKKCLRFTDKGQTEQQVVDEIRSALNRWQAMLDEDGEDRQ